MVESTPRDDAYYRRQCFWLDSLEERLDPRPPLLADRTADVTIVGAGFTGLWTAYYLKKHAPMLDIAVLEADIAGFGASGRNGGWASAYLAGIESMVENPDRREGALRLQRTMVATLPEIARVTQAEGIDCHFEQSGHLAAAVLPHQLRRLKAHVEEMRELGFGEQDLRYLDADEMNTEIRIAGTLGGFHMAHCAAIHPARLVRGLATAVERQGVTIYEGTPVKAIGPGGAHTPNGTAWTKHILIATEGYSQALSQTRRKLIPIHSMMAVTRPLSETELEQVGLRRRSTFNNLRRLVTYGQLTADRRLAFGCRGHYFFGGKAVRTFDAANPAFGVVKRELLSFFPSLDEVEFTHAWGGALGVSRQLEPMVCFDRAAGLGWAGGYFGDGVAASALAGRTLADLVLGRDTERTHTPWVNPERYRRLDQGLWEPEPLRWLGIQARARWMRWTDVSERSARPLAPAMNWILDNLFP